MHIDKVLKIVLALSFRKVISTLKAKSRAKGDGHTPDGQSGKMKRTGAKMGREKLQRERTRGMERKKQLA